MEKQREMAVQSIIGLLESEPFTFEFKVKKNPKGLRIIYEVTQEVMDMLVHKQAAL